MVFYNPDIDKKKRLAMQKHRASSLCNITCMYIVDVAIKINQICS